MATLVTPVSPSMDPLDSQYQPQITGLYAGEDLLACAPCHIATEDGLVYMSNGTAADADAVVHGWTQRAYALGQPLRLVGAGSRFHYAAAMTPGTLLYLGATDGRLDTAQTVGDAAGIALVIRLRTLWLV